MIVRMLTIKPVAAKRAILVNERVEIYQPEDISFIPRKKFPGAAYSLQTSSSILVFVTSYDATHNPRRKTLCTAYGFGSRAHSVFCYYAGPFLGGIFDPGGFSVFFGLTVIF